MARPFAVLAALAAMLLLCASAFANVVQEGNLRVSVSAQVKPYRLPRIGTAPIAVFIAGHIATKDGSTPPQLQAMDVKINRHGVLDTKGLPACRLHEIQPASAREAMARCGDSVVASGHFWASIVLPGLRPYHTTGRLLAFNGVRKGHPVLFAHIFATQPFPASFVVVFSIRQFHRGRYGTELTTSLPQSLGSWGYVNRIKMTLRRTYRYKGRLHSYANAGCPAPKAFKSAVFPLALATLTFAGEETLSTTITRPCAVRE